MFTRVQALNFRSLRHVDRPLQGFHALVGPNASGKTTFLDVIAFLGEIVRDGLDAAVASRTANFEDLVWGRSGTRLEFAVEACLPDHVRARMNGSNSSGMIRYEIGLELQRSASEVHITHERVLLPESAEARAKVIQGDLFPRVVTAPESLFWPDKTTKGRPFRAAVKKTPNGNDVFYTETSGEKGKGWTPVFRLGPRKSALGNLPEDETKLPASTWLKELLTDGVQSLMLNSLLLRRASPPGLGRGFRPDGSNVPWVLEALKAQAPDRYRAWMDHVGTGLPGLKDVMVQERPDDRHKYMMLRYESGLEIPSWMASDGTLRLLALTLPAYLPDLRGVFLVEEPENGIHPRAVETVVQSLKSVYTSQVLLATHSPTILAMLDADDLLCFAKTVDGETDIVRGSEHPALRGWKDSIELGILFAGGVLG